MSNWAYTSIWVMSPVKASVEPAAISSLEAPEAAVHFVKVLPAIANSELALTTSS